MLGEQANREVYAKTLGDFGFFPQLVGGIGWQRVGEVAAGEVLPEPANQVVAVVLVPGRCVEPGLAQRSDAAVWDRRR